jgi:hypothetical protein
MLNHSDYDMIVGFQRTLIILLFIFMIIGLWFLAILFLKKASSLEMKSQKQYLTGISLFAFFMGLGRLLFLYHDYYADNSLDIILWKLGNSISIMGLSILAYVIESFIISNTKKIFTIIGFISAICILIFNQNVGLVFGYIGQGALSVLVLFVYLRLLKISTGDIRKFASIIVIGIICIALGQFGGTLLFNAKVLDRAESQIWAITFALIGFLMVSWGLGKGFQRDEK